MNTFFIIGILICILICFLLQTEGFEDVNSSFDLDSTFLIKYNKFMKFYNTFMENWTKSIITSMNTNAPVQASSSQNTGTPPQPTIEQMNQYIQTLNKKDKTFPPITELMPEIKTTDDLNKLQLPQKAEPFKNALDWMNTNLSKALESMPTLSSIQGFVDIMRGYHVEGFKDAGEDICQQITSCQEAKNKQNIVIQKDMEKVFDEFDKLEPMLQKNQELIAKSKEIQDKAENGSLLPKAPSIPSPYRLPSGSDKLQKMKQDDPEKYKEYEKNYAPFVAMKQSFDGINSVLR